MEEGAAAEEFLTEETIEVAPSHHLLPSAAGLEPPRADPPEQPLSPASSPVPPQLAIALSWRLYPAPLPYEIDYLRDLIASRPPGDVLPPNLGLGAGSGRAPAATAEVLLSVAEDIQHRMVATGGLDAAENYIKRRRHNNENFYEQDDEFIDDEAPGVNLQQLVSRFEDFFCFRGSKEEFEGSLLLAGRLGELERVRGKRAGTKKTPTATPRVARVAKKPPKLKGDNARKPARPRKQVTPDRPICGTIQLHRSADGIFSVVGGSARRRKPKLDKNRPIRRGKRVLPAAPEPLPALNV